LKEHYKTQTQQTVHISDDLNPQYASYWQVITIN